MLFEHLQNDVSAFLLLLLLLRLFFVSCPKVEQRLLHLLPHAFRANDAHHLAKAEEPAKELLAYCNGNGDFKMALVHLARVDVSAKPVNDSVHQTVLESQGDMFNLAAIHGEGVVGVA